MSKRIRLLLPSMLGSIAVLYFALPAAAQEYCGAADWARVVELSGDARDLLDGKRYDEALAALKLAYSLCPDPRLHRSIGKVYLAAGRDRDALSEFEACLVADSGLDVHEECRALAAEASGMVDRTAVSLDGLPPGAIVQVDGEKAVSGDNGLVKVVPGSHKVAVRADGFEPFDAEVLVERGRITPVTVEMALAAAAVESTMPDDAGGPAVTDDSATPPDVAIATETGTGFSSVGGKTGKADAFAPEAVPNWVGLGLGAAALGVGVAFLAQYGLDVKDVEENPIEEGDGGYWEREVGVMNMAVGASFTAAGVIAVILSAALWPDAKVKPAIAAAPGGGVVGLTFGL